MKYIKYISAKLIYHYYRLILLYKYNIKPNDDGSFDLKSSPAFKDAVLFKKEDYD